MSAMADPVQAQLDAYNARDIEAFLSCYTEDCVGEDGGGVRIVAGHAEMRLRYTKLFGDAPTLHCTLVHRIRIADYVIDEESISGRVAAGSELRHAVVIYRLRGDLVEHVRFYRAP